MLAKSYGNDAMRSFQLILAANMLFYQACAHVLSDMGEKIRQNSSRMNIPPILYAYRCPSPVKSINQYAQFYHMTHKKKTWRQKVLRWELGNKLDWQVAAIGEKIVKFVMPAKTASISFTVHFVL